MKTLIDLLGVVVSSAAGVLLVLTIWKSIRQAWSERQPRHLDIVLVVLVPLVQFLSGAGPLGRFGNWFWAFGVALVIAQPYLLLRLVRRFREVPRSIDWTVTATAVAVAIPLFWFRATDARPVVTGYVVFALLALYPALAFYRESLRTAGVTRMRLVFSSAGTLFLIGSFSL